jgi:serine/threonine protein phosphatase PrpC
MTRALGDFYAHQFGLTWEPSITITKAPQNVGFQIIVASDGIWDCWKYEDFTEYMNTKARQEVNAEAVVQAALNETITRAITNFGSKHYDDACMELIISPNQK